MDVLALFDENVDWAKRVARAVSRRVGPAFEVQDLEQECLMELWKRANSYDPAKNDNFRGYAYLAVRGAALMKCRRRHYEDAKRHEDLAVVNATFQGSSGASGRYGLIPAIMLDPTDERAGDVHQQLERRLEELREARRLGDRRRRVLKRLQAFPPALSLEAYLVRNVYFGEVQIEQAAKDTGMSLEALKTRLTRGVRMLRKMQGA